MRIGLEGLSFQKDPNGIGKYFLTLVESLLNRYPNEAFYCYSNHEVYLPESLRNRLILRIDSGFSSKLKSNIWLKLMAGKSIKRDHLDFYISSAGFFPRLSKKTRKVALVHDLNYKIVPKTMGWFHWLSHFLFLKNDVKSADLILTNSNGTSEKIFHFFGLTSNLTINPPTNPQYRKLSKKEVSRTLDKYELQFPYFLTVGTLEPRKNLILTINMFLSLINKNKHQNHKLVIVGGGGWKNSKILSLCDSNKDHIIRLGYVPEEDLPGLYNGATAFLFPSIYEGFGMPVREAVCCGCRVICSDLIELKESSYGAAIYINPMKEEEYLNSLDMVLNEKTIFVENMADNQSKGMTDFLDFFTLQG